jgi:hypothetical protein
MSSLDADKETELIEPNFKQCMLNFWGGQLGGQLFEGRIQ